MYQKFSGFIFILLAFFILISTVHAAVTVVILNPDGNRYYNPDINNVRISFTIVDTTFDANDDVNFSIYLSKALNDHNKTIIADRNADVHCGGGSNYASTVTCQYDWNSIPANTADGNWKIDINAYTRRVSAPTDINTGQDVSNYSFVIDASVPTSSITTPGDGEIIYDSSVTLVYTGADVNSGIQRYYVREGTTGLFIDNGTSTSYTFTGLSSGTHILSLKSTDLADNNSTQKDVSVIIAGGSAPDTSSGGSPYCGDGTCKGSNEDSITCPRDCPAVCGDTVCNGTETEDNCAVDCIVPNVCGNTLCEAGESCSNCSADCGTCTETVPPTDGSGSGSVPYPADQLYTCQNVTCNDSNPCTQDSCNQGNCLFAPLPNGTTCGFGNVCTDGYCVSRTVGGPGTEGISQDGVVPAVLVILIVIGIGYYTMVLGKKKW